ncbi:electron transfer flavoprotein subunit beta, partial [Pseudomonas aeruginosa]
LGLVRLSVLDQPAGAVALPALAEDLRESGAQLVLTGWQAESGEGSGMLRCVLAERVGWPLVVGVAVVVMFDDGCAEVLQAVPRGLL